MTSDALKPCPFCGSPDAYLTGSSDNKFVTCPTCGCNGPGHYSLVGWNTRATPTSNPDTSGPDWEGFGRALMEEWPTSDIDGSSLFQWAVKYGLVREIPGGYDPEEHIDAYGIDPDPGDPWYEYAFGPKRTPLDTSGWRSMDDPELPKDGTQFLSMQDEWGPFVTWRDDTRNYPWRFLDRDNEVNGFRDGEHGPTRWMPLHPTPGAQPTEQPPQADAVLWASESGAIDALASYQQADEDGIMVLVSRKAIEECLPALRAIAAKGGE